MMFRKIYLFLKEIISFLFGVNLIIFFWVCEPFIHIRIVPLPKRIGEMALRTYLFLKKIEINGMPKRTFYICTSGPPTNRQLLDMFKRKLTILENPSFWLLKIVPFGLLKKTRFHVEIKCNSNEYDEFNYGKPLLEFTLEEEERGSEFLRENMGINLEKDWFVCIFARDSAYLQTFQKLDWSGHDYRNSDINTYRKAIEYIIEKGGYVIRMGSVVEKAMDFTHEKFIDYSTRYRDDFMDVYLSAHCKFFMGDPSGATDMATIFQTPKVDVNYPIDAAPIGLNNIFIPKLVIKSSTGENVNIKNVIKQVPSNCPCGYDDIEALGYEYANNEENDILALTEEMFERLEGKFSFSNEDEKMLQKYTAIFPENHWTKRIKKHIGKDFLRKNKEFYT